MKLFVPLFAICIIAFLEYTALHRGIDGAALSLAVGSIAGIGGYIIPKRRRESK